MTLTVTTATADNTIIFSPLWLRNKKKKCYDHKGKKITAK